MIETIEQYTTRLLALAADADPLAIMAATPSEIGRMIAGRSAAELQWSPEPGRWSIAQIVAHVSDAEVVLAYRVRMILSAPGAPIQAYDQDAWSRAQHAESADAFEALALFTAVRTATLRLLRGLTDAERDRYGIHSERGQESIRRMTQLHAGHDRNHLGQIERLLASRSPDHAARAFSPAPAKAAIEAAVLEQLDVRVGTIRHAAPVAGADRLALLTVSFADRERAIVAGIRSERPSLEALIGRQALFVVNLAPKTIRGQRSEGMLFDIGFADGLRPAFAVPEWPVPDGVRAG
jgi:tRNA-binding EMAP/Myf-like protein